MFLSPQQTRFFFLMYILLPFVAGVGHLWDGNRMLGGAYLFVCFPYLLAYFVLRYLSRYSVLLLQALGALMMVVIGVDFYQRGNVWIPLLLVVAAVLNVYVFWFGNHRRKKTIKNDRDL